MTSRQLKAKFPNCSEEFLRRNADDYKAAIEPVKDGYYQRVVRPLRQSERGKFFKEYEALQLTDYPTPVALSSVVISMRIEMEPKAQKRPKVGANGKFYHPSDSRQYQEAIRSEIISHLPTDWNVDGDSSFGLRCAFYRPNRQRMDVDNMLKAVCDAANGTVWRDDAQVMEVFGRKFLSSKTAFILITIFRLPDESPRICCAQCQKLFIKPPTSSAKYCSRKCQHDAHSKDLVCLGCGVTVKLLASEHAKNRKFCTKKCAGAYRFRNRQKTEIELEFE